jgi:hypothetical protein
MLKPILIYSLVVCLLSVSPFARAAEEKKPAGEKKDAKLEPITNWPVIEKNLKLALYKGKKMSKKIRIAILDNGFNGYLAEKGTLLPDNIEYTNSKPSATDKSPNKDLHGVLMAVLVNQVIKRSGVTADYEIKLFNSEGHTKFVDAVEKVIEEKFDVVLYSQVWEYGGNGDGKGFINTLVNKATAAGIIWINAAGNFDSLTRTAAVDGKVEGDAEWVVFKDSKGGAQKGAKFICKAEKCAVTVTLSWLDFKDETGIGTDKDLDLVLVDSKGKELTQGKSELRQKLSFDENDPNESASKSSLYPRERIDELHGMSSTGEPHTKPLEVLKGEYWARVKVVSKNFSASQDKLRLTFTGVEISDPDRDETLLPPADNSSVIVIGASDAQKFSSRSVSRKLPDILFHSEVRLKDGKLLYGSSTAAAMATGLAVINLGLDTEKNRDALVAKLKSISGKSAKVKDISTPPPAKKKESPTIPIVSGKREVPPQAPRNRQQPQQQAGRPQQQQGYPQQGQQQGYPQQGYPQQGPSCLPMQQLPQVYPAATQLMSGGGAVSVFYQGWTFILVDPRIVPQVMQLQQGMRLFMTPQGMVTIAHRDLVTRGIPRYFYEILPTQFYQICR